MYDGEGCVGRGTYFSGHRHARIQKDGAIDEVRFVENIELAPVRRTCHGVVLSPDRTAKSMGT
jgi:hypothetical protein